MADGKTTSAAIAMLIAAASWGFVGIFTRNLNSLGFSTTEVVCLRTIVATAVFVPIMAVVDRSCFKIKKRDLWLFAIFGLSKFVTEYFFMGAQLHIDLAVTTVLQFMSPYWVLIESVFLFGEVITRRKVFAICLGFLGCMLVTGVLAGNADLNVVGVTMAIMSGVVYSVFVVGCKILVNKGYKASTTLIYTFIFAIIFSLPFMDYGSLPGKFSNMDSVINILGVGLLVTLMPYFLQLYATKSLSAVSIIVLGLIEVVVSASVGLFIYSENLSVLNILGMVLIPVSIVIMNVSPRHVKMLRDAKRIEQRRK